MTTEKLKQVRDAVEWLADKTKYDVTVTSYADAIIATLDSLIAGADGWVMVPIEPTEEMIDNAQTQDGEPNIPNVPIMRIYKAMIAAAPKHGGEE